MVVPGFAFVAGVSVLVAVALLARLATDGVIDWLGLRLSCTDGNSCAGINGIQLGSFISMRVNSSPISGMAAKPGWSYCQDSQLATWTCIQ